MAAILQLIGLRLHNIVAHRIPDKLSNRPQIQLIHNIGAVSLRRLDAYIQRRGDFFIALALRQQLNDLALTRG
jgi:hypothetical protein